MMDARVAAAINLIHKALTIQLSVSALSRRVNLSPSRLRQLFKIETGLSPIQYVKRVRLERAANLLRTSFLSVKEIIFQSGARDVSNFAREFKKQFGLTPSEFRARSRLSPKIRPRSRRGGE
jgi:transcriptional regulator GlxA family with amidase domain